MPFVLSCPGPLKTSHNDITYHSLSSFSPSIATDPFKSPNSCCTHNLTVLQLGPQSGTGGRDKQNQVAKVQQFHKSPWPRSTQPTIIAISHSFIRLLMPLCALLCNCALVVPGNLNESQPHHCHQSQDKKTIVVIDRGTHNYSQSHSEFLFFATFGPKNSTRRNAAVWRVTQVEFLISRPTFLCKNVVVCLILVLLICIPPYLTLIPYTSPP